jgi:hypothetical protein
MGHKTEKPEHLLMEAIMLKPKPTAGDTEWQDET